MTTNPNTPAPDFEVSQAVRDAARLVATSERTRVDEICLLWAGGRVCGQIIAPLRVGREEYFYSDVEKEGLLLAHLMQRHGWTRESTGEH
jgi:hypothetical protein